MSCDGLVTSPLKLRHGTADYINVRPSEPRKIQKKTLQICKSQLPPFPVLPWNRDERTNNQARKCLEVQLAKEIQHEIYGHLLVSVFHLPQPHLPFIRLFPGNPSSAYPFLGGASSNVSVVGFSGMHFRHKLVIKMLILQYMYPKTELLTINDSDISIKTPSGHYDAEYPNLLLQQYPMQLLSINKISLVNGAL